MVLDMLTIMLVETKFGWHAGRSEGLVLPIASTVLPKQILASALPIGNC
jgi:hypothetical protein